MNELIRRSGNFAVWSCAGVLVLGVALLALMNHLRPEWFCRAINSGGKEFVCGAGYSVPAVLVLGRVGLGVSLGLYGLGVAALFKGSLRRGGIIMLCLLSVLFVAGLVLTYVLGQSDSP